MTKTKTESKLRTFLKEYKLFGFFNLPDEYGDRGQCAFCPTRVSNSSLKPSLLSRHLENQHENHKNKELAYYETVIANFKGGQLDKPSGPVVKFSISDSKLASLKIAYTIGKHKLSYCLGEDIIRPMLDMICGICLYKPTSAEIRSIPLSHNLIKSRTEELSENIKTQLVVKINKSAIEGFFAIQIDKSTDCENDSRLSVFILWCDISGFHEEFLTFSNSRANAEE